MTKRGASTKIAELRGPVNGLIVDYMRRHNIETIREFADQVGIGRSTVYDLVRGRSTNNDTWSRPSLETIVRLASFLERPTHELLYLIEPDAPGADLPLFPEVTQVPIAIAGHAGAGPDQSCKLDGYTYVEREFATGRDLIAFRIVGDSMAGGTHPIYKDDLVIVDRRVEGEINSAVVARLSGDGYVCKRLRPGNVLDSSNPEFLDPQLAVITGDRIEKVIGKVVRIIHTSL